jgi:intermembrane space import and assembly protein 40
LSYADFGRGMQDCFRLHPDMYGSELEEDEDEVDELLARETAQPAEETPVESSPTKAASAPSTEATEKPSPKAASAPSTESKTEQPTSGLKKEIEHQRDSKHTAPGNVQIGGDEGEELLPKSAHDATR